MACWTQALHEYLLTSPPEEADEATIRALLCTTRRRIDLPPAEHVAALRAWLAKSSSLTYRHALSSALPHTEDFNRLGGPLLAWGLTRPWRSDIQTEQVLDHWRRVLNEPNLYSDTLAANMAYATRLMVELLPLVPEETRLSAAETWTDAMVVTSPNNVLWQPNMYKPEVRSLVMSSWADMHTLAKTCFGAVGTEMWEKSVRKAFNHSGLNHAQNALVLARSSLPDDIKLRGVFCANPTAWLHPELLAQLAPLLCRTSPDPVVRIYSLPWATQALFDTKEARAEFQRRLCESYCPELVPMFALCSLDWTDRVGVFRLASMFSAKEESFAVAGLLDTETQQVHPFF